MYTSQVKFFMMLLWVSGIYNNWNIITIPVIFCSTRAMKCSMDELKFAATWKSSGIQGAKFSIKVIFKTFNLILYIHLLLHPTAHKHVLVSQSLNNWRNQLPWYSVLLLRYYLAVLIHWLIEINS